MSSPPGRRAGLAIIHVELDEKTPDRILIRVRIVDDVFGPEKPVERPFTSAAPALAYISKWLATRERKM